MKKTMKRIFLLLLLIISSSITTFSQSPQAFKYQAIARNSNGIPLQNQTISLKISILSDSISGQSVYSELQSVVTNNLGLFNIDIGYPDYVIQGSFNDIDWGNGEYFLNIEIDQNGGFNFTHLGTSEILSVPYALYAKNVENSDDADADPENELQFLEQNCYNVSLSKNGGNINTGIKSFSENEIGMLDPYDGMTVHNSTTNCLNYYYSGSWHSLCSCSPEPTQAYAGNDQLNIIGNSTQLEGNQPIYGIGEWNILSGNNGNVIEINNPTSIFTGLSGEEYLLEWSISNECGSTSDSVTISFSSSSWECGSPITDLRDAKTYETVLIGNQCWMAENLNIGVMINGSSDQVNNEIIEKYCYSNLIEFCETYGGLYQWDEMMQYAIIPSTKGICPTGWHIPSDEEWCELEIFLDGNISCSTTGWRGINCGGKLKETGTSHWNYPNVGATNESGFTGLPSGARYISPIFDQLGDYSYFYTSTRLDATMSWIRALKNDSSSINRISGNQVCGYAVRCVKND